MIARRRTILAGSLALLAGATLPAATPAATPERQSDKPIRIVVGYAPGGATDVLARHLAQRLAETLGQTVIVDNRAGANGNLAADAVARSPADGHTLLLATIANTINTSLYPKLGFEFPGSFTPIGMIAAIPNVMVVHPGVPSHTVKEFIALARSQPGRYAFASSGSGSSIHLSGELFKVQAGVNLVHVPYRGSAPAINDLLGGQVQLMFDNLPSALPHIRAGRLRALAVTTAQRSAAAPEVPTLAESGLPHFEVTSWFGLVAPARLPKDVQARLHAALTTAQEHPVFKERLAAMGAERVGTSPEGFASLIAQETRKWSQIVQAAGIQPD